MELRDTRLRSSLLKINFITAKSILNKAQSISLTVKSILLPAKKKIHNGKIIFINGKIHFTTAKSFMAKFAPITKCSQSAMGVNPTWLSSTWFHDSTCIAQTVEIGYLSRNISACSVDKVSRNCLIDVFKYTQWILFGDWLTFTESHVGVSSRVRGILMKGMFITTSYLVS